MDQKVISENTYPYFYALTERVSQLVWISRDHGDWAWASPSWTELTSQSNDESQGSGWESAIYASDREATKMAWAVADRTGILDIEHRLLDPRQPNVPRWFHTRAKPLPNIPGRAREWLGCCTDIHDRKMLQDDAQHRINQLHALVRTVIRHTATKGMVVEDYAMRLDTYLGAIARTESMLRPPGYQVDLAALVAEALLAHAAHEGDRITIAGPRVSLARGAAQVFGLAMHGLAMNAIEHGALSVSEGSVRVHWASDGELLRFEWAEDGGDVASGSLSQSGFDKGLAGAILNLELDAMVSFELGATGALYTIVVPFSRYVSAS